MWRDHLEKVTQYYFLATYYHGVDKKRCEKYTHRYHHHLRRYVESHKKSGTYKPPVSTRIKRPQIRLLHAAVSVKQAVDVYIDGKYTAATVRYLTPIPPIAVSAGKHRITLYPTKQKLTPLLEQEVSFRQGKRYLLVVADKSSQSNEGIQILRYEETESVPKNKAKLRFIHLSPDAPAVDLEDGQHGISFRNVTYKESTPYVIVEPGRINVMVTVAGTRDRIASISFDVKQSHAYTLLVAGQANNPYWLLLLDR